VILRHAFIPPDNTRLANLAGSFDEHLRTIAAAFDVKIQRRNESFRVEGAKGHAERAVVLLQQLYGRAARPIGAEELELAILEAMNDDAARDGAADPAAAAAHRGEVDLRLRTRRADLAGRTPNQVQYLKNILGHDITFGIGPAGTGKTYLAVACAVDALERNAVQRIILTRPAVEAGERLGFLPGDLAQKVDPYLRPLYDALYDLMGFDKVTKLFERNTIEIAPLAYMRGRTLNHSFIILDEAQNTTPEQMKMFLTRIGFGTKAVITGDVTQIDLARGQKSGLVEADRILSGVRGIAFVKFTSADVVRHPLVQKIIDAYDRDLARGANDPPNA
jgi:phosphate starvation-inducible PhoH-like protein